MAEQRQSFLDTSVAELVRLNWEKVFYLVILILAVASRFWDLGARAMSHDESLHALYSYYLYHGDGYVHNPMMHGPFLFHANALIYFLFGDSDFTARIIPALFGVFMVMSPLFLRRWLGRLGTLLTSVMLLISPSILYYSRYIRNDIYITVWTILLIAALFHFLRSHKPGWLYVGAGVLMLSLATKENAYIFGYTGLVFIIQVILWERVPPRKHIWLYVGGGVLTVALIAAAAFLTRTPAEVVDTEQAVGAVQKLIGAVVVVLAGTLPAVLVSATLLRSRHPERSSVEDSIRGLSWREWLIAFLVMLVLYALLFTTFFTNPLGLGTGVFGSISYWLAQQDVQRGGQPWYYYLLLLPMYDFLPLLFGAIGVVYYLVRGASVRHTDEEEIVEESTDVDRVTGRENARFVAFLVFWTITALFIYSWAGEKMPWLVVHPVLPMIVLAGKLFDDLLARVNWRAILQRGGVLLALLLPVTVFGVVMLIQLQPFQGLSLSNLQETGNWLTALVVTLLLLVLTGLYIRRVGARSSFYVGLVTVGLLLVFFTVRFAWMAAYINYDYATELLVYAHGGADAKPTMEEIADISMRTVGDKMIKVAYDNDVTWPLEWYMREYPNRVYYGDKPTREQLDVPVVLVGDKNEAKVQPFLGDRYYRFKRRLVWWPNQEYMGLTWERIRDVLTSSEKRKVLWDVLYYREYPRSTDDWYHVHNMYLYVRKDVAQQVWDFGAVPPEAIELPPDLYAEAHTELPVAQVWGEVGVEPGLVNHPRGIAIGPDGLVYVVDSDNHRIQVFDSSGSFVRAWGSQCNLADGLGCVDPDDGGPLALGDGQFQEPWGIAVAPDGRVYVADTWNHRIQVFDAQGQFLQSWGMYGQSMIDTNVLYGPRDVAVDESGRVFVTDTGNKRIMVFDLDGTYLHQWGGGGIGSGQFEEPVGLALDGEGNLYVADTWNQRVQVFDGDYVFLREWSVDAWYGESVVNKPFIAVDGQGRVYITDPEGYQVVVFYQDGELAATFGRYGFDSGGLALPTGIDIDDSGYIYIADTDGQHITKYEPLALP